MNKLTKILYNLFGEKIFIPRGFNLNGLPVTYFWFKGSEGIQLSINEGGKFFTFHLTINPNERYWFFRIFFIRWSIWKEFNTPQPKIDYKQFDD